MSERNRAKGVAIAITAVACVTPDSMLLRWARVEGASPWQTAFFKMNMVGVLNLCSALYLTGGVRKLLEGVAADPLALFFASLLQVGDQLGFTFSFLFTDTARAMLFISLNPVWAALLGYAILGDALPPRTLGLLGAGIFSSLIVFTPSLLGLTPATPHATTDTDSGTLHSVEHQPATLFGDCVSLATGLCLASYVTFIRYCARHRPSAAIDAAPSFGNFLAAAIALLMTTAAAGMGVLPGVVGGIHLGGFVPVVTLNALLVAAFYVGFTIAPRYITGAEVALILLVETVCGPLWIFLRFGDVPSSWTIAGGAVLLCALALHEVLGMRDEDRELDGGGWGGGGVGSRADSLVDYSSGASSPVVMRLSPPPLSLPRLQENLEPLRPAVAGCSSGLKIGVMQQPGVGGSMTASPPRHHLPAAGGGPSDDDGLGGARYHCFQDGGSRSSARK